MTLHIPAIRLGKLNPCIYLLSSPPLAHSALHPIHFNLLNYGFCS